MSETPALSLTDPASYTPMGQTDYLIIGGLAATIVAVLAITYYSNLESEAEDLEIEEDEIALSPVDKKSDLKLIFTKRSLNVKLVCHSESFEPSNLSSITSEFMSDVGKTGFSGKLHDLKLMYPEKGKVIAYVGLGKGDSNLTRAGVATAVESLKKVNHDEQLNVEIYTNANIKQAAEGAALGAYSFQKKGLGSLSGDLNADSSYSFVGDKSKINISMAGINDVKSWTEGVVNASAQNLARSLTEMPANKLTPIEFCNIATSVLKGHSNVSIHEYDEGWISSQNMGSFLSVTKGSDQPCRFLELKYRGNPNSTETSVLVGKGVTFDAGGISIKPSTDMALMKGDMGGAAVTLSSFKAAVELNIPINLIALIPLTENLINGKATKPGDVVTASNGKTIEVDNTDAEGRLLLADAIYYGAKTYNPNCIVEFSTLTGAMDIALGYHFAGTFTNNDKLWSLLHEASLLADDLLWRMPLRKVYLDQMRSNVADYKNVGGRSGGSCTAAAFLEEFTSVSDGDKKITKIPFAHIDIAGVFHKRSGKDFLANGMTGRPTRTVVEFLKNLSKESKPKFF